MDVIHLDRDWEARFLRLLRGDPLEYYWFLVDWTFNRAESTFLLAVEGERIEGALISFAGVIAQIRGRRLAVEALIEHLDLPKVELSVPRGCEDLVLARYAAPMQAELVLMHLDRGNESIRKVCEPVPLGEADAAEVRDLLRGSNPGGWWDELTVEQAAERLKASYWLGVRVGGKLASVGSMRFADFGSNIGVVATDAAHRGRGYATAVVSGLVEEIFRRGDKALIHVLRDNAPAMRAYESVGFREYNAYFLVRNAVRRQVLLDCGEA